ncbi:MAG: PhnE/PtxC family ABC transporter permease [Pseudomonadota bacterium]
MSPANRNHHRDPAWQGRLTLSVIALVLLWPLLLACEFQPWILLDGQSLRATGSFLADFVPPEYSAEFLQLTLHATWQTVAIATVGLVLALLGAIPLTLLATASLSLSRMETGRMRLPGALLRQAVRWLLVVLRSVPELVWALLFVRIVGLGPTAGVLAIVLTYCGMLGKAYAEILESAEASVSTSLLQNGSSRLNTLLYAVLPTCAAELVSYTCYRWECAVRGSVIMGFVGAGGLGQQLDQSMKMLAGGEVATLLIVLMLLVACADALSGLLRKRLG